LLSTPLRDVALVQVRGNGHAVNLTVDQSSQAIADGVTFLGGTGPNRLTGPGGDRIWQITGPGAGWVGHPGFVRFDGVENLLGAADNRDTFRVSAAGSISGTIAGGDRGYDVVELSDGHFNRLAFRPTGPDSGGIDRDGDRITYAGMEPISSSNVTADNVVFTGLPQPTTAKLYLNTSNQLVLESTAGANFETHAFSVPSQSLTINLGGDDDTFEIDDLGEFAADLTLDGGLGQDHVTFTGDVNMGTHALLIHAEVIEVTPANATATVTAGSLHFEAAGNELASDFASNLPVDIADVIAGDRRITLNSGTVLQGGTVLLEAYRISSLASPFRPFGGGKKDATIDVTGATITGSSVTIRAQAEDQNAFGALPAWANNNFINPLLSFVGNGIIPDVPFAVMIREGDTSVTLTDSKITSTGDVAITSTTVVDATTSALGVQDGWTAPGATVNAIYRRLNQLSVGYSQAVGSALTTLAGTTTVNAAGNVQVASNSTTTASITSRTTLNATAAGDGQNGAPGPANQKNVGASIAVSRSVTTSKTTLGPGTAVTAGANVTVSADGTLTNNSNAGVGIYLDGLAGLSIAVSLDTADIETTTDGKITATGSVTDRTVPIAGVDPNTNTLTVPQHGFATGDKVTYLAADHPNPSKERKSGG
jgi:hypothetical protein